jgi:hypothetical protein
MVSNRVTPHVPVSSTLNDVAALRSGDIVLPAGRPDDGHGGHRPLRHAADRPAQSTGDVDPDTTTPAH